MDEISATSFSKCLFLASDMIEVMSHSDKRAKDRELHSIVWLSTRINLFNGLYYWKQGDKHTHDGHIQVHEPMQPIIIIVLSVSLAPHMCVLNVCLWQSCIPLAKRFNVTNNSLSIAHLHFVFIHSISLIVTVQYHHCIRYCVRFLDVCVCM